MRHAFLCLLAICFLCSTAWADAPRGFKEGRNQGVSPVYEDKILTFTLMNGQCSKKKYGDGRGESDCFNGNSRSQIHTKDRQRLGRAYEYAFDFRIAPGFRYNGKGWGPVNYRSRLWIAEWQRIDTIKNHMYEMYLDTVRGAMFEDKVCVPPARLNDWNAVRVRVKWSDKDDGWLQVSCNGRIIYSLMGPNAIPPGCGKPEKLQCKLELQQPRKPIQWQFGPHLKGHGRDWKSLGFPSVFPPFPDGGIVMQARNIYFGRARK